jgi:hypothetical protein
VSERVTERLDGNMVKLAGENRSQSPRCALNVDLKLRRRRVRLVGSEVLAKPAYGPL